MLVLSTDFNIQQKERPYWNAQKTFVASFFYLYHILSMPDRQFLYTVTCSILPGAAKIVFLNILVLRYVTITSKKRSLKNRVILIFLFTLNN